MHHSPWQNIRAIRQDTTALMYALLGEMRRLQLDFRLTPQPVHIESPEVEHPLVMAAATLAADVEAGGVQRRVPAPAAAGGTASGGRPGAITTVPELL